MPVTYSHVTTADGSRLYTIDGSPIVVAVYDTLTISCPANISITTPFSTPIVVTWSNPTATGGIPPYTFSSSPESGSTFPIGTTEVTVQVEDSLGNISECSFTVTVALMASVGCKTGLPNGFQR